MRLILKYNKIEIYLLMITVVCIGLLALSSGLCFAQSLPMTTGAEEVATVQRKGRWQMQPSLTFYQQYSDNVDLLNEKPVAAWQTQITPSVSFTRPIARRQLKLDMYLKMDYRNKDNGTTESFYWYDIYGYMGHEVSPRLAYDVSASIDVGYTETNVGTPFVNVFGGLTRTNSYTFTPALRYNLTRTTLTKLSYQYNITDYTGADTVDGEEHLWSLYLEQKLGSRIVVDVNGIYDIKNLPHEAGNRGYTDILIPFGATFDLTYTKVRLGGVYLVRSYRDTANYTNENRLGFQLGFELGGKLLRLKATSVELNYNTRYYNDLYGDPYENQELKLGVYHAFRKFDVYFYLRGGNNIYLQKDYEVAYNGLGGLWKWKVNNLMDIEFRLDLDNYDYTPENRDYSILRGTVEWSYYVYDWLMTGLSVRHTQSSSSITQGNYDENVYAIFARAVW